VPAAAATGDDGVQLFDAFFIDVNAARGGGQR
jgi:hypothetical protein